MNRVHRPAVAGNCKPAEPAGHKDRKQGLPEGSTAAGMEPPEAYTPPAAHQISSYTCFDCSMIMLVRHTTFETAKIRAQTRSETSTGLI